MCSPSAPLEIRHVYALFEPSCAVTTFAQSLSRSSPHAIFVTGESFNSSSATPIFFARLLTFFWLNSMFC